jgi:hypothetical protein
MSDTETVYDTSDEEIRDEEYISVGGKAPRVGTANRVLPVSDEAFKIVILQLTQ